MPALPVHSSCVKTISHLCQLRLLNFSHSYAHDRGQSVANYFNLELGFSSEGECAVIANVYFYEGHVHLSLSCMYMHVFTHMYQGVKDGYKIMYISRD